MGFQGYFTCIPISLPRRRCRAFYSVAASEVQFSFFILQPLRFVFGVGSGVITISDLAQHAGYAVHPPRQRVRRFRPILVLFDGVVGVGIELC